jgi:two-component system cell cycle sensor histidine kinase/response regulator CckA
MSRYVSRSAASVPHSMGTQFLEAAANDCPHGLMIEQAGRVVYSNPAYARLVGFKTAASALGKRVAELSISDHRHKARGDGNGNGCPAEFAHIRMEFRRGRRRLTLHVVRDVSELKRLEQRLRESEKMEALGRLVGGVAHDFNNVLTAITLYADLLLERTHRRREAEEIHLAAQRGTSIVRQLLTFARQQPLAPRLISLRNIITSMRGMLEPLLGEDIELITRFDCDGDTVRIDPAQMQQVILNLVMNARDAMPQGGHVRIATGAGTLNARSAQRYPGLHPGDYVILTVSDNGCGMDEEVRAHLFEPFFTTKRTGQGVGLGMSMIYGIVTQSGGAVSVASKPGMGTRVTIHLPHHASPAISPQGRSASADTPTGTETILLVEDDHAVRSSVAHLLTESGYQVLQARDGDQAIRIARARGGEIDLLISDIVMPGMGGNEVAVQVQKLHTEAKLLFISGYPVQARLAAAGAKLLCKPFSRAQLAEKVREVLDHRPAAAAAASAHSSCERKLS